MEIISDTKDFYISSPTAVAIGKFDGVHIGHQKLLLEITDKALGFIADEAYDPHYGARPIKRYLQQHVETEIAEGVIRGTIIDGQKLTVDSDGERLTYTSR